MKPLIRRLGRNRHAVYGALLQGALTVGAGLYFKAQHVQNLQDNPLLSPPGLIVLGSMAIVLAAAVLTAIRVVKPVPVAALTGPSVEGEIVELQQPQLPDVQTHTRRTPELTQAA